MTDQPTTIDFPTVELTEQESLRFFQVFARMPYLPGVEAYAKIRGKRGVEGLTHDDILAVLEGLAADLVQVGKRQRGTEDQLRLLKQQQAAVRSFLGIEELLETKRANDYVASIP